MKNDRVRVAAGAVGTFSDRLLSDLDTDHGGFSSWAGHIDQRRVILISDYLISVVRQIQASLTSCGIHLTNFDQKWHGNAFDFRKRLANRRTMDDSFLAMNERELTRSFEIDQIVKGFFVDAGTILDSLGAVFVGIAAVKKPITEAAWASISKAPGWLGLRSATPLDDFGSSGRSLQEEAIRKLGAGVPTSPANWMEWTLDLRNALVHRGLRLAVTRVHGTRASGLKLAYLLPRNPKFSDAEAFARGKNADEIYLSEHASDTMNTVLTNVTDTATRYIEILADLWEQREQDKTILIQPGQQWRSLELTRSSGFQGSGSTLGPMEGNEVRLSPKDGRRLKAAKVLTPGEDIWRELKR